MTPWAHRSDVYKALDGERAYQNRKRRYRAAARNVYSVYEKP